LIPVYYGSDEEQTGTTVVDAADQKCHTHRIVQQGEREEKRERTHKQIYVVHLEKGYIHGGKIENYLLLMQYISGSLFPEIQGILALYK